jgi:hypothetical protein
VHAPITALLLITALHAASPPGWMASWAGEPQQAPQPADPPGSPTDPVAPAGPPGPASPEATGSVVMGAVDAALAEHDVAVELRGSPASMARQHAVAVASGLTFVGTLEEMDALVDQGTLVAIDGGRHYEVMDWVFPYGIPEVRAFVLRLAYEYRQACGEEMVVTSLTRPFSEQPRNAHQLSVHPAGMAVDLRIPQTPACRAFLDERLLEMEENGLVDATHERSPPHFHVAVFPEPYTRWAALQPPLPQERRKPLPLPLPDDTGSVVLWLVAAMALVAGAGVAWARYYQRSRR